MSFSTDVKDELMTLKMWDVNSSLKQEEQIARLQLRETFIKCGSMADPKKEYHLEVLFKTKKRATEFVILLENFNIPAKIIKKGNGYITYIKDSENIVNFLALIGANNAVLRFEETRVLKDARNSVNRLVNCETANLSKTANAAVRQVENIKLIQNKIGISSLPENLQEIALLRVEHEEMSLKELGEMLNPPISKSGVNHRLKKIEQIANDLK